MPLVLFMGRPQQLRQPEDPVRVSLFPTTLVSLFQCHGAAAEPDADTDLAVETAIRDLARARRAFDKSLWDELGFDGARCGLSLQQLGRGCDVCHLSGFVSEYFILARDQLWCVQGALRVDGKEAFKVILHDGSSAIVQLSEVSSEVAVGAGTLSAWRVEDATTPWLQALLRREDTARVNSKPRALVADYLQRMCVANRTGAALLR